MQDRVADRAPRRTTFVGERGWAAFDQFKAGISGRKGERAVVDALTARGVEALHDVILKDEQGTTQIDHIVRGPDAIIVIETKHYSGAISGTPEAAEWIQDIGRGKVRTSFQNPLRQNFRHVRAVQSVLARHKATIVGAVVSTGSATFSAALAAVITPLSEIETLLRPRSSSEIASPAFAEAWARLQTAAKAGEALRGQHEEMIRARRNG